MPIQIKYKRKILNYKQHVVWKREITSGLDGKSKAIEKENMKKWQISELEY